MIIAAVKYRVIRNDCRGFNNLPPRSPDATPCDFFLCGYVKDQVYVPPLPASIPELKVRIRTAIETITADMLQTFLDVLLTVHLSIFISVINQLDAQIFLFYNKFMSCLYMFRAHVLIIRRSKLY